MSSLRNAVKSRGREHRERQQSSVRSHLGPLEKKKDYKVRAKGQEKKKKALKRLHEKALNKNPDEYDYHMINSKLEDGVHFEKVNNKTLSIKEVSSDLQYISHRQNIERKKIEKIKSELHLLHKNKKPQNSHVLFVDTDAEAQKVKPEDILDTHSSLLKRPFNRLRNSQLRSSQIGNLKESQANVIARQKSYKQLAARVNREATLNLFKHKLDIKKKLMQNKDKEPPKLIKKATNKTPAIYRWPKERKK